MPIFGARIVLNPQRADSHQCVSIKLIASGLTQRCELGQLALRSNQDTTCFRPRLPQGADWD